MDLELLKHAKGYIEKMANGINPLTGEVVSDNDTLNNIEDYFNKNGMSQYLNELRKTINKSEQNSFLEDIKVDVTDTSNKENEKDEVSKDKVTITNFRSYKDDIDIERDE